MSKVIAWQVKAPEQALQALNRRTGLDFGYYPESLLNPGQAATPHSLTIDAPHRDAVDTAATGLLAATNKRAL